MKYAMTALILLIATNVFAIKRPKDDSYLVDIMDKTEAIIALKFAYGDCKFSQVRADTRNGHSHIKNVYYKCSGKKDGPVVIKASTAISTWGKTGAIKVEVFNIRGISNTNLAQKN